MNLKRIIPLCISIFLMISIIFNSQSFLVEAQTVNKPIGIGVIGDSSSDEFRADDNRGGSFAVTTLNWIEQLVKSRSLNFGDWGVYGEPRRSGFEYNWSRSGVTSGGAITNGQHTGMAAFVVSNEVDLVIIAVGSNDFAFYRSDGYDPIYNGTLTGAALTQKINTVAGNIITTFNTVNNAGDVNIAVLSVPDWSLSPYVIQSRPDPAKRQLVSNAIKAVNDKIKADIQTKGGLYLDGNAFGLSLLSLVNANGKLAIEDELIDIRSSGDEPHHLLLGDNIHSGTVMNGLLANFYLEQINTKFGYNIPKLTNDEILTNAGIVRTTNIICSADINNDKFVDVADYTILAKDYLKTSSFLNIKTDINKDGKVDLSDYNTLAQNYFKTCN